MKKSFTQLQWVQMLQKGKNIYNFAELARLTGLSTASLRRALNRLTQKRLLIKLSKGLYANSFIPPSLEEVAGILYPPCYISLESALFMHGILEQAPYLITCVTTNKTKTFRTAMGEIVYFHIKAELFSGFQIQDRYPIATPEKAALDFIYLQRQNGLQPTLDEWNWGNLNLKQLLSLSKLYPKAVQLQIQPLCH